MNSRKMRLFSVCVIAFVTSCAAWGAPASSPATKPASASAPAGKDVAAFNAVAGYCRDAKPDDSAKFWQNAGKVGLAAAARDSAATSAKRKDASGKETTASDTLHQCAQDGCFDGFKDIEAFRTAYTNHLLNIRIPKMEVSRLELKDALDFVRVASGLNVKPDWTKLSQNTPVTVRLQNATIRECLDAFMKSAGKGAKWSVEVDSSGAPLIALKAGP